MDQSVLDKSSHNFLGRHAHLWARAECSHGISARVNGFRYVHVVFVPDCAGVLVSWTVPDSFIDNFFVRHTAFRHTLMVLDTFMLMCVLTELL